MLSSPRRLTEVDIPKLPLYLAFGVIFGVAPMLPNRYNRDLVYLVSTIYKRVGPLGLLGIPFCTLAMEKTAYDTYTAYHGRSIYADAAKRTSRRPSFRRRAAAVLQPHRDAEARRGPGRVPAALDPERARRRETNRSVQLSLNPSTARLPRAPDRQVRVDVLLRDLGDGHLEVLLRHVDAALAQR